jgi:hypothetical protein
MVKKNNVFKHNYIEIVKNAIPAFLISEETETKEDLAYAIVGKTVLAVRDINNFLSANNTSASGLIPYFIPANRGTKVGPSLFYEKVLKRLGKTYNDFKNYEEFVSYLSSTAFPAFSLNDIDDDFASSAMDEPYSPLGTVSSVELDMVSSLGALYLLNTTGYPGTTEYLSSILIPYVASAIWYGQEFNENEAVKVLFEHIFNNREVVDSLNTYLPAEFRSPTKIIDPVANTIQIVFNIDAGNLLTSALRSNVLGVHGIDGGEGEQVSALHRYFRAVSAPHDIACVASSYVHSKFFRTTAASIVPRINVNAELLYFIHRAKSLGYKVKITFSTLSQAEAAYTQQGYHSNIESIASSIAHLIASSFRSPSSITVGSTSISYPGYDIDSFSLDNEADIGWENIGGTAVGFAQWNVSALRRVKELLVLSGISVPKLGPGGFSNYRKDIWWEPYFSECVSQNFQPSTIGVHSYQRNGSMWELFQIDQKIKNMAGSAGLSNSALMKIDHDEYNINFFAVNNDNPNSITPECDDNRGAVCLAANDISMIYRDVPSQVYFIHDKNFNNPNVQYSDNWSGKSPGLFLVSGAPKPNWWAKQMLLRSVDGSGIIQRTRSATTSSLSWHTNCIGSINGNQMKLLLINAPLTSENLSDRNQTSAYFSDFYLDYIAFANFESSAVLGQFTSAIGQGADVVINGSINSSNNSKHKSWGSEFLRSYTLNLKCQDPYNTIPLFAGRALTIEDLLLLMSSQHTWVINNGPTSYSSFSSNNPTWHTSVSGAKESLTGYMNGAAFNTQLTINFDSNFVPKRILSQYLLDKSNNRPVLLPEFNVNDANSSYSRLRTDYQANSNPAHQQARYDAIDLGINPSGKNYGFGTAGQYKPLAEGKGIADLSLAQNALSVVLTPNSMVLLILESD